MDVSQYADNLRAQHPTEWHVLDDGSIGVRRIDPLVTYDAAISHQFLSLSTRLNRRTPRASKGRRASARPEDSPVKVQRVLSFRTGQTRGGVPKSWGNLRWPSTQEKLVDFIGATPLEHVYYTAVDPGEINPVTMFTSVPAVDPTWGSPRYEATGAYGRNNLNTLARRANRQSSNMRNLLLSSLYSSDGDVPAQGMRPYPWTAFDEQDSASVAARSLLLSVNKEWGRLKRDARSRRKARYASVASEMADLAMGGERFKNRAFDPEGKVVVFVGDGIWASSGHQVGAKTAPGILRALEDELQARRVPHKIVIVPEGFTSQRCPNPTCADAAGLRSRYVQLSIRAAKHGLTPKCTLQCASRVTHGRFRRRPHPVLQQLPGLVEPGPSGGRQHTVWRNCTVCDGGKDVDVDLRVDFTGATTGAGAGMPACVYGRRGIAYQSVGM